MRWSHAYIFTFLAGYSWALLAGIYPALFGRDWGRDSTPAGDAAAGSGESSARSAASGASDRLSFFTLDALAAFLAGFGGTGLLLEIYCEWNSPSEVATSTAAGFFLALATHAAERWRQRRDPAPRP